MPLEGLTHHDTPEPDIPEKDAAPDPPNDEPEDSSDWDEPEYLTGESGMSQLRANEKARSFAAALLRGGKSFQETAELTRELFLLGGAPVDPDKLRLALREIARKRLSRIEKNEGMQTPPKQRELALGQACSRTLTAGIKRSMHNAGRKLAYEFLSKKLRENRPSLADQNKVWKNNADLALLVAALWKQGASRRLVRIEIEKTNITVSKKALKMELPDSHRDQEVKKLVEPKKIPQKNKNKAEQIILKHKEKFSKERSQLSLAQQQKARESRSLVGTPLFGARLAETQWWYSPRAQALAFVLFDKEKPEPMWVIARAIETAYGIPTHKDVIRGMMKAHLKIQGGQRVTGQKYSDAFVKFFPKSMPKGEFEKLVRTARLHETTLRSRMEDWKQIAKTEGIKSENEFQAADVRPQDRKKDDYSEAHGNLFDLLEGPLPLIGDDAQRIERALLFLSEAVLKKKESVENNIVLRVSPPGTQILSPQRGKPVPTLFITLDNSGVTDPRATNRRLTFINRVLNILTSDPSKLKGNDRKCYAAFSQSRAELIIVDWRDRYTKKKNKVDRFPAGSFLRK